MRKIVILFGMFMIATLAFAQNMEELAIVTDCKGKAFLERDNVKKEPVKKDETIIHQGDVLVVEDNSYVVIETDYGDRKIIGKKRIVMTPKTISKLLGANLKKSSWLGVAFGTLNKSKEIENYYRPGSVRGLEEETPFDAHSLYRPPFKKYVKKFGVNIDYKDFLLEPKNGSVLNTEPRLVWFSIPKAKTYYIFVLNMEDSVLKQYSSKDTTINIEKGILDADDIYKWIVIADLGSTGLVDSGRFNVMDSAQSAEVKDTLNRIHAKYDKKDPDLGHFIAASYLNEQGLYCDALQEIDKCTKDDPTNIQYWRVRAVIHHNMGLSQMVRKDIDKIYQLSLK